MHGTTRALITTMGSAGTVASALAGPAAAATNTSSLNVSATVVASCTISPALTASPQAASAAGPAMCKGKTGSGIVARRPQIYLERDELLGITRVVFAF